MAKTVPVGGRLPHLGSERKTLAYLGRPRKRTLLDRIRRRVAR
jgi:hypothetical protein